MDAQDYWIECLTDAAEQCGLAPTREQLASLADAVRIGHEAFSGAFNDACPSDRLSRRANAKDEEAEAKVQKFEEEFLEFQRLFEASMRKALRIRDGGNVVIDEDGAVYVSEGSLPFRVL